MLRASRLTTIHAVLDVSYQIDGHSQADA
eukprot:COSAG06_NODE_41443_length_391_cov_0.965753_1_plen_28_part_10